MENARNPKPCGLCGGKPILETYFEKKKNLPNNGKIFNLETDYDKKYRYVCPCRRFMLSLSVSEQKALENWNGLWDAEVID